MDFSKIHASGVSSILKKGQSYSASSSLRHLTFTDVWHFKGPATKFLDASVLQMDDKGKNVGHVDYSHLRAQGMSHSGDQIALEQGTHTVEIDLHELPANVSELVFVISAWGGATLLDIISPSVSFCETAGAELCSYDLDAHDKVAKKTAVIMCRLYKAKGGWHVQALGEACEGTAGNYAPILAAYRKR
jgi:stress response protein SCP2